MKKSASQWGEQFLLVVVSLSPWRNSLGAPDSRLCLCLSLWLVPLQFRCGRASRSLKETSIKLSCAAAEGRAARFNSIM